MCLSIPGEVIHLTDKHGLPFAKVRFGGVVREVCMSYQPDAVVGDFVLVHVGFAIAKLDRDEAARTLAMLRELGDAADLEEQPPAKGPVS